jgi:hypothetical protein
MKKIIKGGIIFLFFAMISLQAMTRKKDEELMGSMCNYDLGLDDFQIDWENGESKAFIESLKHKRLKIYPKNRLLAFTSDGEISYCYSMEVASNKFYIIEKNAKLNETTEYILQCLFLNKDTKSECPQEIMGLIKKSYGDNCDLFKVWERIRTIINENRINLGKAFEDGKVDELAVIVKKPLFLEHIDKTFLEQLQLK